MWLEESYATLITSDEDVTLFSVTSSSDPSKLVNTNFGGVSPDCGVYETPVKAPLRPRLASASKPYMIPSMKTFFVSVA